jgi:RNA 3'-terminal phosphate cyclase (ATP)
LSVCLGKPFQITHIRARRDRPGLQAQHLAAVRAAGEISKAEIQGGFKGSQKLSFRPTGIFAGDYRFSVGTAGSTMLVLQTVLPALALADAPSSLTLEGGTHNPFAPPFDFIFHAFLPLLRRMGTSVAIDLERPGFAPRGGGRIHVDIQPVSRLKPLDLDKRGEIQAQHAEVWLANLREDIAWRELAVIQNELGYSDKQLMLHKADNAYGPGNAVSVVIESEYITECFTQFGRPGLPAERVAGKVLEEVRRYVKAGVPVGSHLADQLLLPMALAGSGSFVTLEPSSHTLTNIQAIRAFTTVNIQAEVLQADAWKITIQSSVGSD